MTSTSTQPSRIEALRNALRRNAGAWLSRLNRHEILLARTVRGMQAEAVDRFDREIVQPLVQSVAGRLATFDQRGAGAAFDLFPQLRELRDEMAQIVERGAVAVERMTRGDIAALARHEVEWAKDTAGSVLKTTPPAIDAAAVIRQVEVRPFLGRKVEEWFRQDLEVPTGDNARALVQQGLVRGWTVEEITRGLRGRRATGYTDGILTGSSASTLRTIVRTAATHASATAREETFRALGVKQWRFVATLDAKTSIQCASQDGKTYPLGDGPVPPLHPNCRSVAVPDLGEPIGNRASIDGPVPATTDYETWLEGQGVEQQDEVLGRTRAKAWRAGDIEFADLIGRDLQPLSIAELRRLDRLPTPE